MDFRRGATRVIAVSKSTNESVLSNKNESNKQITLSFNSPQSLHDINLYLQTCPISAEDNDLLQAKIQKTPSSLNGTINYQNFIFYSLVD